MSSWADTGHRPSSSSNGTALRWRARVAQQQAIDAVAASRDEGDEDEDWTAAAAAANNESDNGNRQRCSNNNKRSFFFFSTSVIPYRRQLALLAGAAVILSAVAAAPTWWMAATAAIQLVLLLAVHLQHKFLRRHGRAVEHHCHWTRNRVRQLWEENATLHRRLQHSDAALERVREMEGQLAHLTMADDGGDDDNDNDNHSNKKNGSSLDRLVQTMQQHRKVQADIRDALRRQVQEHILTAVLEADRDRNFALRAAELERLIVRLQAVPGVTLNESALRSILTVVANSKDDDDEKGADDDDKTTNQHSSSVAQLLQLLRHAQQDGRHNNNNNLLAAAAASSSSSIRGSAAVFTFDPTQVTSEKIWSPVTGYMASTNNNSTAGKTSKTQASF